MKNELRNGGCLGMLGRVVRGLGGRVRARELVLKLTAVACPVMLMLNPGPSLGQGPVPPDVLPFQGTLVNGDGDPLGTPTPKNYDVIFRIFDDPSAGKLLWAEQQTVTVDAGQFSVQLGLGGVVGTEPRPSLASLMQSPNASDRYLETTVQGVGPGRANSTLLPRVRLLPVAYAMVARLARTADRLVNAEGGTLLSVVGSRIGVKTTAPASEVDVAGSARAGSLTVSGSVVARGGASAGSWTGAGAVPVGTVILWSGPPNSCPSGWAMCDGSTVNNYRTPDLRGRFVLGAGEGSGLTARRVGEMGGTETATLGLSHLPSHSHFMNPPERKLWQEGSHSHRIENEATSGESTGWGWRPMGDYYKNRYKAWAEWRAHANEATEQRYRINSGTSGGHSHVLDGGPTDSSKAGQGQSHNNMPPYYVLAYIVRVR